MDVKFEVLIETLTHISGVCKNLAVMRADLEKRGISHDRSKLTSAEFDGFVSVRPKLKKSNYGSPEYRECIDAIETTVAHHYRHNRHHPEFHDNGFPDMNLLDILEMLADWKEASGRNPNLSFADSLPRAFAKYSIPDNMQKHIMATLEYLDWL